MRPRRLKPSGTAHPGSAPAGPSDGGEEAQVARGFRRGSSEAVDSVRHRVRRIVAFRGYRFGSADRKDLEQEVMTQLWQAANRAGFDPDAGFWGLVEVITARRCIDWLRTQRPSSELDRELEDPASGPLRLALGRERSRLVYAALAELDEPCRELIYLRIGQGRPYRALASELGRSEGALRVQMHRCVRRLRQILDQRSS